MQTDRLNAAAGNALFASRICANALLCVTGQSLRKEDEEVVLVVFAVCGEIRAGSKLPVLTAYFPRAGLGHPGQGKGPLF